jgi:exodeoxyribonuclease VII large subunit
MQRLDDLGQRLGAAARSALQRDGRRFAEAHGRLLRRSPLHALSEWRARHQSLHARLHHVAVDSVARAAHRLALAQRGLDAVSPLATLTRGFAIVTRADGALVSDAGSVSPGEDIEARLARGTLTARVTGRK